ncbi:MAG: hypothetical protein ACTSU4_05395 [Promethearchaeota archaeon]
MEKDHTELHDIIKEHPEQAKSMIDAYEKWARRCVVIPREKILEFYKKKYKHV